MKYVKRNILSGSMFLLHGGDEMQDDIKAVKTLSNLIATTIKDSTSTIEQDVINTKKDVQTLQRKISLLDNVNFENYYTKSELSKDMRVMQQTIQTDIADHDYDIKELLGAINVSINDLRSIVNSSNSGGNTIADMNIPTFDGIATENVTNQLAALVFDGSHIINIGYHATNNTKIEVLFNQSEYGKFMFGTRTSASSSDAFAFCAYSTSMYPQFGSFQASINAEMSLNAPHYLELSQSGIIIDGVSIKTFDTMSFNSTLDLYIGTRNTNGALDARRFVGNIYIVRIYESNSVKMVLLPYNDGNTDGLYDAIGNTFYPLNSV